MNSFSKYQQEYNELQAKNFENTSQRVNIEQQKNEKKLRKYKDYGYLNQINNDQLSLSQRNKLQLMNSILKDETISQVSSFDHSDIQNSYQSQSNQKQYSNQQQATLISNQQQVNQIQKQKQIISNSQQSSCDQINQTFKSHYNLNQQVIQKQNDMIQFFGNNQYQDMNQNLPSQPNINHFININQNQDKNLKQLKIYDDQFNDSIDIDKIKQTYQKELIQKDKSKSQKIDYLIIDDESKQSIESIDKNKFNKTRTQKPKKISKCKHEKMKQKENLDILKRKQQIQKQKNILIQSDKKQHQCLILNQSVSERLQFFVFCDIYIEDKMIKGNRQQTKRSNMNFIKQISKITEHKATNQFEISFIRSHQTYMEFENYQQILLNLQDQYAKEISDSLQHLQKKSRLALETIEMIQNNRQVYEYILQRKQHAEQAYEDYKKKTLTKHKYYFSNRYIFDLRNGNFSLNDIVYSQHFINLFAINSDYLKQMMSKFGLIEFFKLAQKFAFQISFFSQFIFNMKNMPKVINYILDFVTLDNIEIKLNVTQHMVDLCKDFDELNNFDCPFIDFVFLVVPQITEEVEESLAQIRLEQNIDINTLLEMDDDEIDFYYNYNSQQFMKKYYTDIYSRSLNCPDLSKQKVDFTNIKK